MVGCAILLYSIRYIKERRVWPFIFCVLLASCFHYSCVIFIVSYYLYNKSISRNAIIISTIVIFALSSVFANLINSIAAWTPYAHYIGGYFDTGERGYVGLVITIVITVIATIYYDVEDKTYRFYYNLNVVSLWLSAFVGKVVLISRIRWMFGLPVIIFLPMVLEKVNNKTTRFFIAISIVILYFAYFYYTIGINNSATVLPYQTILSR